MTGWNQVLQGKHLSPTIPHLSLTQVHRAKRTCSRDTQHTCTSLKAAITLFLNDNCWKNDETNFNHAGLTFSYFICDAKDFSQLRNSFVERLNVEFHISCWKHTQTLLETRTVNKKNQQKKPPCFLLLWPHLRPNLLFSFFSHCFVFASMSSRFLVQYVHIFK